MALDSKKLSEAAKNRPRDKNGHFLPLNPPTKTSQKTSGAADLISNFIHTEKEPEDDAILNLKINNPLSKIVELLKDIKAKQATTVSLRFTIPLIALPVAFFLVFQLGRYQNQCPKYQNSLIGTVKTISIDQQDQSFFSKIPFISELYAGKERIIDQSILVSGNNQPTTIHNNTGLDVNQYDNQSVIITGHYSSCANSIILTSPQNITLSN